ncbi:hypothetical protein FN846DRAFT_961913 [Sphaerosporella brunnea]|uniref:DH domain-containing protein n=1 Tax=Sphaerosporella brunnea TaxID=1250544 RepID=A0A5J5ENA1_9PEZI|nr:hypothetical protein FN846DRAFT_961913 [Sphaerosporella brunnea]
MESVVSNEIDESGEEPAKTEQMPQYPSEELAVVHAKDPIESALEELTLSTTKEPEKPSSPSSTQEAEETVPVEEILDKKSDVKELKVEAKESELKETETKTVEIKKAEVNDTGVKRSSTEETAHSPAESPDLSAKEPLLRRNPSTKEPRTPSTNGAPLPPQKDPVVFFATKNAIMDKQKAMGCVEEPPKRSVRDLVRQLESKPDKTVKQPPPDPLRELLKESAREAAIVAPTLSVEPLDSANKEYPTSEPAMKESPAPEPLKMESAPEELAKKDDEVSEASQESIDAVEPKEPLSEKPQELTKEVEYSDSETETETESETESDSDMEPVEVAPLNVTPKPSSIPSSPVVEDGKVSFPSTAAELEPAKEAPRPLHIRTTSEPADVPSTSSPASPLPKRSLRSTPAPPRPKSIYSALSDGSLTPLGSVYGDSVDGDNLTRSPSEASKASTVKPLRFTKVSNVQMIDIPKRPSNSKSKAKQEEAKDGFNLETADRAPSLRRKYTKTADLISILSAPKSSKSMRSAARSRQSKGRKHVETMTIEVLLKEFAIEEVKYMRELRTLVEDVVPILFQTVLGRADDDLRRTSSISSIGTSGSGSSRGSSRTGFSSNPTRPIVDMGISLERLRTLHERIPVDSAENVLKWASDAHRVYEEYLSVWRMGFQDVVVTMTPDDDEDYDGRSGNGAPMRGKGGKFEGDPATWALPPPPHMVEEPKDERVDVAFLLKRPLVRLKLLAKLFKRIDYIQSFPLAASLSNPFHDLVAMARRKISEEKARIEDEAAAALDPSKARDIHTMLLRKDVCLDQNRRVKARDAFAMRLFHSSDEVIERNIELILRDPAPRARYSEAEVLFVELGENTARWLLFPPVPVSCVSARTGDAAGEIVVMVRGVDAEAQAWREIMALASSTAAGFEWVQMLGLIPIPPEGPFTDEALEPAVLETVIEESVVSRNYPPVTLPTRKRKSRYSPREPALGRKANAPGTQSEVPVESVPEAEEVVEPQQPRIVFPPAWLPPEFSVALMDPPLSLRLVGGEFVLPQIKLRTEPPESSSLSSGMRTPSLHTLSDSGRATSPSPSVKSASSIQRSRNASKRHSRKKSTCEAKDSGEEYSEKLLSRTRSIHLDEEEKPAARRSAGSLMDNIPDLSPSGAQKGSELDSDAPPPVPPHRTPTNASRSSSKPAPIIKPGRGFGGRRRTSSPLKHEYDPSSPSNSETEHREQHSSDEDYTSSSPSEDESDDAVSLCSEEEDGEYPPPMLTIPRRASRLSLARQPSPSTPVSSLTRHHSPNPGPSSAAIEHVNADTQRRSGTPPQPQQPPPPVPQIGAKFKVFIFAWATNQWDKMSPGECMIIVTPGHIEAFTLPSSAPSSPTSKTSPPNSNSSTPNQSLFDFDLSAVLQVRRGTAVDISIRTPQSCKLAGASIMLRSRSPNECEMLFNTINSHRILPPGLQLPPSTTASTLTLPSEMGTSDASTTVVGSIKRGFGSWARSKTYRAGGASVSTPSLVSTPSEASVNSLSSAFSRFRAGKIFRGSPMGSLASSSSSMGDSSRGGTPIGLPNVPGVDNNVVTMSPMKIRLYRRDHPSKWRDLGNARLNVFKPMEGARPGKGPSEDDKRIVITNKKGDTVLLDVVLGESAFERVARTGIAVSVLTGEGEEDGTGKPSQSGGIGAKSTVYMMQMKGEAEAAFSFSILGKLRY